MFRRKAGLRGRAVHPLHGNGELAPVRPNIVFNRNATFGTRAPHLPPVRNLRQIVETVPWHHYPVPRKRVIKKSRRPPLLPLRPLAFPQKCPGFAGNFARARMVNRNFLGHDRTSRFKTIANRVKLSNRTSAGQGR